MRLQRLGFELRMELAPEVPRVVGDFADLHVGAVRRVAGDAQPVGGQLFFELAVELVTMPMPLADLRSAVRLAGEAVLRKTAWVRTQTHGAAKFVHSLQLA